jgi:hypothetical protein
MAWKALIWAVHLLFWIALALILYSLRGNRRSAIVLDNDRVEFAPNWVVVWAWMLVDLRFTFLASDFLKHGSGEPWAMVTGALFGLAVLMSLFTFPETVIVTREGVEQVYWLRRNKRIRWEEIVEINSGVKDRILTVTGANGTKIVHSCLLADRPRFLLELKQHCRENLPPDFPREPIAGL